MWKVWKNGMMEERRLVEECEILFCFLVDTNDKKTRGF
jgi:hypothetical protein